MKKIMIFASALALVACGGSKDDSQTQTEKQWRSDKQTLVYSYPTDGQLEVPNSAPVVLSFSSAISATHPEEHITVTALSTGEVVPVTAKQADSGTSLVLTPEKRFHPLEKYQVEVGAINLEEGVSKPQTLRFNTRGLAEGPAKLMAQEEFDLVRRFPDGSEQLPVVDFSSFRYQFSQPIAVETARYGEQITLLDASDSVVEAEVLVHGAYLTIDPKEDLQPNTQYTIAIDGLQSTQEQSYSDSWSFTPKDTTSPTTGKREKLVQDISANGEGSPLTGNTINKVPMASVLLGQDTATQASGVLEAELAFVPHFPDVTPFRIAKGSLIKGSDIEVLIGGLVPAGFNSGDIRMHFISDATGYLMPNAYSDQPDAPRHVRLFMDMAISAETDKANGAITQDLMHIELAGTAIVEDGSMVINAVGVVEPNVLGSEYASGLLSFYMKSFEDQVNPPTAGEDDRPLVLQSWVPGDTPTLSATDDPIVLTFNKPVKASEFEVALTEAGEEIGIELSHSGTKLIIQPNTALKQGEDEELEYQLQLGTDGYQETLSFALPVKTVARDTTGKRSSWWKGSVGNTPEADSYSPVIFAAYPGYPCVLETDSLDLTTGLQGWCKGSINPLSYPEEYLTDPNSYWKEWDDAIPVGKIQPNAPIVLSFSKAIDPSTVNSDTFIVEEVDSQGNSVKPIKGSVEIKGATLKFYPETAWQENTYYRYTLKSSGYREVGEEGMLEEQFSIMPSDYNCGLDAICGIDGLPVQTRTLGTLVVKKLQGKEVLFPYLAIKGGNYSIAGGPDFTQYFESLPTNNVLQHFVSAPTADTNRNFFLDRESEIWVSDQSGEARSDEIYTKPEKGVKDNKAKLMTSPVANEITPDWDFAANGSLPAVNGITIGCPYTDENSWAVPLIPNCSDDELTHTFLNTALIAEVGEKSKSNDEESIPVIIWPSQIIGTSVDVNAIISVFAPDTNEDNIADNWMLLELVQLDIKGFTGPQIMRMRYALDEHGNRTQPIQGEIRFVNDQPQLSAKVDLYLDVPFLARAGMGSIDYTHSLTSQPITMELTGPVEFLPDGRMQVIQYNLNPINLDVDLGIASGHYLGGFGLGIPSKGSILTLVSEVIK